jgi:hypothetical protein
MTHSSLPLPLAFILITALNMGSANTSAGKNAQVPQKAPGHSDRLNLEIAREAHEKLAPFKKALGAALKGALTSGGPVKAIDVCRLSAPELAKKASTDGIRVGRTSDKLRNPKNDPPGWAKGLLAELKAADPKKPFQKVQQIDDQKVGYVEGIVVQPICLTCHGADLPASVSKALQKHYPNDQATGYQAGDFRGLFWMELPRK